MFDIGWVELLVVAIVAIIVIGPRELPAALRSFGNIVARLRRTSREFRTTFDKALRDAEKESGLAEVGSATRGMMQADPLSDIKKSIGNLGSATSTSSAADAPAAKTQAQNPQSQADKVQSEKSKTSETKSGDAPHSLTTRRVTNSSSHISE